MADVAVKYDKEEIPEQLAKKFNEDIEEYDWRVLVNPGVFVLVYDVSITLSTDPFDLHDVPKDIYLVYGVQIVDNHPRLNGARY
jgi:predicted nucleotidyltransferase